MLYAQTNSDKSDHLKTSSPVITWRDPFHTQQNMVLCAPRHGIRTVKI